MKSHTLLHMLLLLLAVAGSYVLAHTLGATHDIEIVAGFFIIYILCKKFVPDKQQTYSSFQLLDALFFTLTLMTIVLTTGGLLSPFFFLVYFLLFALGLMLEPLISLTTALGIIAAFLPYLPVQAGLTQLAPLLALPFLVPFAVYMGNEHRKRALQQQAYDSLSAEHTSKQQDALLFISTVVRGHIKSLLESVENFHGDHELNEIRTSARRLQKLIDKFEKSY